ncbi:hypothetical protein FO519_009347, partial [Halicephalobus sp. NKZ332]
EMMGSDPDYKYGAYVTTLRLSNRDQIRLIISKKFGNWPKDLLRQGDIISVSGEKIDYYGMKAISVRPRDHLDTASDDEFALARRQPRSNLRSCSLHLLKLTSRLIFHISKFYQTVASKMVVLATLDEITNYQLGQDCDVILKVTNYFPQEKCKMLFIDCRTQDDRIITCCGPISLHRNENEVKAGDILEFQNVRPHEDKKAEGVRLCLKMSRYSIVSIINFNDDSRKQIIPFSVPSPPDFSETLCSTDFETASMASSFTLKPKDNKIVGIIKNNFIFEKTMEDDPDYEGVYVTTLLLFNGEEKELIISKKLGTSLVNFLHPIQIISIDGRPTNHNGKDAIFIGPGDHLDIPSIENVTSALQCSKSIPGRKNNTYPLDEDLKTVKKLEKKREGSSFSSLENQFQGSYSMQQHSTIQSLSQSYNLTNYDEIKDYPLYQNCDVMLKVVKYCPQPNQNLLFINCKTKDERDIVCLGPINLHSHGTHVKNGQLIELKDVERQNYSKNSILELRLQIHGNSTVTVIDPDANSKKQIIPQLPSSFPDLPRRRPRQHSRPPSVVSVPVRKSVENPKIIGTIQNELTFVEMTGSDSDCKYGAYLTTLQPFNENQVKLIIPEECKNRHEEFLHPGKIISVVGEKMKYYGMDAILVRPGNHLKVASKDEISLKLM